MRKRYAFIIREAILDARSDMSLSSIMRYSKLQVKTYKEFDLYLRAHQREINKLLRQNW